MVTVTLRRDARGRTSFEVVVPEAESAAKLQHGLGVYNALADKVDAYIKAVAEAHKEEIAAKKARDAAARAEKKSAVGSMKKSKTMNTTNEEHLGGE